MQKSQLWSQPCLWRMHTCARLPPARFACEQRLWLRTHAAWTLKFDSETLLASLSPACPLMCCRPCLYGIFESICCV